MVGRGRVKAGMAAKPLLAEVAEAAVHGHPDDPRAQLGPPVVALQPLEHLQHHLVIGSVGHADRDLDAPARVREGPVDQLAGGV